MSFLFQPAGSETDFFFHVSQILLSPTMISFTRPHLLAIKHKEELYLATLSVLYFALFSFSTSTETILRNAPIYIFMPSLSIITCYFRFYFQILLDINPK